MNEEHQFTKYVIISVVFFWIFFAIFFGMFDLELSIRFVDSNSFWAYLIEKFGELPGYLTILLAFFLYNMERRDYKKETELLYSVIWFLGLLFLIYSITERILEDHILYESYRYVIILIISLFIVIFGKIVEKKGSLHIQQFMIFSRVTLIIAIINPFLLVQTFKILWGRVRFRNLAMDYSDYSPWYLPQGITGHKSFPSGHAAMGWMLLPIILLIDTKNRKIRILMSVLIVSWGILVALGRVVIGAHYASDVLFSSAFGVLCYFLFSRYFRFHPPSNSKKGEKY